MKAVIAGSTGLVGKELVALLNEDPRFENTVALVRRNARLGAKVTVRVCNFDEIASVTLPEQPQFGFCCLGTTIKIAGSQEAFRKVDFDYVVNFGKLCKQNGVEHFVVVSALGANAKSNIFYSRIKGETEDALRALGFKHLTIVRPSLLLGKRDHLRVTEELAKRAAPALRLMIPGFVKKYRPVEGADVAKVMLKAIDNNVTLGQHDGYEILKFDSI